MATDGECSAPARKAARPSGSGGSGSTSTSPRSAPSSPPLPGYVRVTRDREIGLHLVRMPELIVAVAQMDKAALLGEVVRELQAKASDATEVVLGVIPGESDEVGIVEEQHDDHHWRRADHHHHCYSAGHGPRRVRAWVFCADRPGLLSDIGRQRAPRPR
jgi:hypothetical protein